MPAGADAGIAAAQAPPPRSATAGSDRRGCKRTADRIASIDAQADRIDDYNPLRNLQQIYGFYYDEALWDQVDRPVRG